MEEYSWPDWEMFENGDSVQPRAWRDVTLSMPIGTRISGRVVGRQPFGVFLLLDGQSDVVGLAEITSMPIGMHLPLVGEVVSGRVIAHTERNRQIKIRLDDWV